VDFVETPRRVRAVERPRYSSPLREAQARQTRARIRDAARALFAERGFDPTTIAAIAERAGVSAATVYATFESKAGIVADLLEALEHEVDMPGRVATIMEETDPRLQVRLFVASNRAMFENGVDVLRAAAQALGTPEVAALKRAGDANRRRGCDAIARALAAADALVTGLDPSQAAEQMWLLSSLESYLSAVDALGWPADRYERWLDGTLAQVLLRDNHDGGDDKTGTEGTG
jgi:AcrR family transcriptional regulator